MIGKQSVYILFLVTPHESKEILGVFKNLKTLNRYREEYAKLYKPLQDQYFEIESWYVIDEETSIIKTSVLEELIKFEPISTTTHTK